MQRRMNEKGFDDEVEEVVQRAKSDSNVGNVGVSNFDTVIEERWMNARPPPFPVSLGELMIEKFGGQRLRSKDGGESGGSHVSVSERM